MEIRHKADSVTFPRSGHHYLVDMLSEYFHGEFRYYEPYRADGRYDQSHIAKTHDFDLEYEVESGRKLIVQIRSPMPAIVSHYEMHTAALSDGCEGWRKHVTTRCACDCMPAWRVFLSRQIDYYAKFYHKWVVKWHPDRLILHYEDLRIDRKDALNSVLAHLGVTADHDAVLQAVDFVGELPIRRISEFKYYDPVVFDKARMDVIRKIACPTPETSYDI